MRNRIAVSCLLLSSMGALVQSTQAQTVTPTILQLDETNLVSYYEDTLDWTKAAISSAKVAAATPTFSNGTGIGDIVAVNGQTVKGMHITDIRRLNSSPSFTPGQAIADVTRLAVINHVWEILGTDGITIGTIMAQGFAAGTQPPGAPSSQTAANLAITGVPEPSLEFGGLLERQIHRHLSPTDRHRSPRILPIDASMGEVRHAAS